MFQNFDLTKKWVLAIFLFVGINGATIQMRGALIPAFKSIFSLSETYLGLVAPAGTVSVLTSIMIIGMLTGRINIERTILIGLTLTAVFTLLIGLSFSFLQILVLFFVQGLGVGVFRAIDRPILSHLFPKKRARIFNLRSSVVLRDDL